MPWCAVHGGLVAWVAATIEQVRAPVLLFSLLVGIVLGATLAGAIRLGQVGNRPTILLGTVLAALIAVLGQHYIGYREACQRARQDRRTYDLARLAFHDAVLGETPVPPSSFVDFLRWRAARGFAILGFKARGAVVWLIWTLDGLVVLGAALGVVVPALRKPYCDRCRSWFGTVRRGRIGKATARELAAVIEADLPEPLASARYRLFTCRGGCGPTGLDLEWQDAAGHPAAARAWLGAERRNRVAQTLDKGVSSQ
jgi:hypothetical protein